MIPISTDAPIYHYPVSTVTLIVINVVCFVAFCLNADSGELEVFDSQGNRMSTLDVQLEYLRREAENPDDAKAWLDSLEVRETDTGAFQRLSLQFGHIRPWQWLTNNFMHAGWGHLIGNMVFLWAFGLVVEGKVGNLAFVAIYLGMGTVYGMLLQLGAYFFVDVGIALGASSAIFGLLALCMVWAPANEFSCIIFYWVRDVSILAFAAFYIVMQVFFLFVGGFRVSSELLHILGFLVGFPLGVYLLRTGRVDCEGWDLFSYMSGNTGRSSRFTMQRTKARRARKSRTPSSENRATPAPAVSTERLQDQVGQAIDGQQFDLAVKLQNQLMQTYPGIRWRQKDLYRIVDGLLRHQQYDQAIPLIQLYLQSFTEKQFQMQLALMKIWILRKQPRAVFAVLDTINTGSLSQAEREQLDKIRLHARKLQTSSREE